jgi:hypothetical protein
MLETKGPAKSWSGKTELLPGKTEGMREQQQEIPFICPEYKEQVADGVVYLRASCHKALCVKWRGGHCQMCSTSKSEQLDLLEGRS